MTLPNDAAKDVDARKRLIIYLNDHHAAAQAGQHLAERCAASNSDNELGDFIRETLLPAIRHDQTLLNDVFAAVDAGPSTLKDLGARIGEFVARAKPNGQLTGYSPLSRVIEVEGLIAGVSAKRGLWTTVESLRKDPAYAALPDASARITAADDQRRGLQDHHVAAVLEAFLNDRSTPR